MAARYNAETKTFILETAHSSYMMKVSRYGNLLHMYYGSRIPDEDLDYLLTFSDRGFSPNPYEAGNDRTFSLDFLPQEFSGSRSGNLVAKIERAVKELAFARYPACREDPVVNIALSYAIYGGYYAYEENLRYGGEQVAEVVAQASRDIHRMLQGKFQQKPGG